MTVRRHPEHVRKLDQEFKRLSGGLAKAFRPIDPAKGAALVDEAVRAARGKRPK